MAKKKRELQAEIDKCIKETEAGIELVGNAYQKLKTAGQGSTNREKFEQDYKREVKKLQRIRDQIKVQLNNSDVKDKSKLLEARRRIEQEMERYRELEQASKTKAYSKKALEQMEKQLTPMK